MKLARREFLHLAAGATRPAGPAGPPGGGGGGGRPFGQNVLDYGANPTGQSDSVGAFEAAMKAARSAGYGLIKVPLGKYRFSRACNQTSLTVSTVCVLKVKPIPCSVLAINLQRSSAPPVTTLLRAPMLPTLRLACSTYSSIWLSSLAAAVSICLMAASLSATACCSEVVLSFISIRPGKPTLDNVYSSVPAGPTRTALAVKSSGRNARLIP